MHMKTIMSIAGALWSVTVLAQAPSFHAVPTDRADVTMNVVVVAPSQTPQKVLLVVPGTDGSEGRIRIRGAMAPAYGALQYLYAYADEFKAAGIALVAIGCPTDQWERYGQCDDDYRSSTTHVQDVQKVMDFLKAQYNLKNFYVLGTARAVSRHDGWPCACRTNCKEPSTLQR